MIRVQMMKGFRVDADGTIWDKLELRSPHGVRMVRWLIVHRGESVTNEELSEYLNQSRNCKSQKGSVKTLVSRTRGLLKEIHPDLGDCLQTDNDGYKWVCGENVTVDALELADLLEKLAAKPSVEMLDQLQKLYEGEIREKPEWNQQYLWYTAKFVSLLNKHGEYNRAYQVSSKALRFYPMDEKLRILQQEAEAGRKPFQFVKPAEDPETDGVNRIYQGLISEDRAFNFSLDAVHNEMMRKKAGPCFCDYEAFRRMYVMMQQQPQNNMFLGIFTVSGPNSVSREGAMASLNAILRNNLLSGDVVTQFSANITAALLSRRNYDSGMDVVNRVQKLFYATFPDQYYGFYAKVRPLIPETGREKTKKKHSSEAAV
ncbi:MAG: hypothetical protein IJJ42_03070 [Clostridia bacterium]|nr:hypothetical protein [Clostridia bacterium]